MQIGGAPLEKARSHTVRTAAFLAGGAGGCGGLAAAEHSLYEEGGPPLFEVTGVALEVRQARLVAEGTASPAVFWSSILAHESV